MKTLSIITSIVFILNGLIHLMGMVTSLELKEAAGRLHPEHHHPGNLGFWPIHPALIGNSCSWIQ